MYLFNFISNLSVSFYHYNKIPAIINLRFILLTVSKAPFQDHCFRPLGGGMLDSNGREHLEEQIAYFMARKQIKKEEVPAIPYPFQKHTTRS